MDKIFHRRILNIFKELKLGKKYAVFVKCLALFSSKKWRMRDIDQQHCKKK